MVFALIKIVRHRTTRAEDGVGGGSGRERGPFRLRRGWFSVFGLSIKRKGLIRVLTTSVNNYYITPKKITGESSARTLVTGTTIRRLDGGVTRGACLVVRLYLFGPLVHRASRVRCLFLGIYLPVSRGVGPESFPEPVVGPPVSPRATATDTGGKEGNDRGRVS